MGQHSDDIWLGTATGPQTAGGVGGGGDALATALAAEQATFLRRITRGHSFNGVSYHFKNGKSFCFAHAILVSLFASEFFVRKCYESIWETLSTRRMSNVAVANNRLRRLMFDLMDVRTKGLVPVRPTARALADSIVMPVVYQVGNQADWSDFYDGFIPGVFQRGNVTLPSWIAPRVRRVEHGIVCGNPKCSSKGKPMKNLGLEQVWSMIPVAAIIEDPRRPLSAERRSAQRRIDALLRAEETITDRACPKCETKELTNLGHSGDRLTHVGDVLVLKTDPYFRLPDKSFTRNKLQWPEVLRVPVFNLVTDTFTEVNFVLCGVIQHKGANHKSGHFVAFVRKGVTNPSWYFVDDLEPDIVDIIDAQHPTLLRALDQKKYDYGNKMSGAVYVRERPLDAEPPT